MGGAVLELPVAIVNTRTMLRLKSAQSQLNMAVSDPKIDAHEDSSITG